MEDSKPPSVPSDLMDIDVAPLVESHPDFWARFNYLFTIGSHIDRETNLNFWHNYPQTREQVWADWQKELLQLKATAADAAGGDDGEVKDEIEGEAEAEAEGEGADADSSEDDTPTEPVKPVAPKKKQTKALTGPKSSINLPPYTADVSLQTEEDCRAYIAYPDPQDTEHIAIQGDDWQYVKTNRIQDYTGQIYYALAHPYADTPPTAAEFKAGNMQSYVNQQKKATNDVSNLLQSATQIKAAKANCQLLVCAAVHVNEVGFNKQVYNNRKWYSKRGRVVPRDYRLDTKSICSDRLAKIVEAVKNNKLVAKDVITGTNFNRMVQDPDFYVVDKFKYLSSNARREQKAKELTKIADGGKGKASKRVTKKRSVQESDDESEEEEWDSTESNSKEGDDADDVNEEGGEEDGDVDEDEDEDEDEVDDEPEYKPAYKKRRV